MGQALYRKYRTRSLRETIGQEHITATLEQALKQGRVSHAYLFTGPRGVGKTSVARILAHEINGLPYDDDSPDIDIIEIDAASNRRIDEIRELRDKVYVAPASSKYKVYIIDEVHMLTKEAFNALLKTLEEPPEHAVFILATTDAHKLPDTIISRTQRFTFKPVSTDKVAARLSEIANKEKIKISQEALLMLAEHGEGSFRDSISLLDQLGSHGGGIDVEDVRRLLGIPPAEAIDGLMKSLSGGEDASGLVSSLNDLLAGGYRPAGIAKQISQRLRQQLIDGQADIPPDAALNLLEKLIEVPVSHDPERFLEITLLGARQAGATPKPAKAPVRSDEPDKPEPVKAAPEDPGEPRRGQEHDTEQSEAKATGDAALDESLWPEVLQTLKRNHNTLYGVVRMAQPEFNGDTLKLSFAFAFHQKRIKESSNRQKLADVIHELTGRTVKVECELDPSAKPPESSVDIAETPSDADLDAISNIFGAAEVLES